MRRNASKPQEAPLWLSSVSSFLVQQPATSEFTGWIGWNLFLSTLHRRQSFGEFESSHRSSHWLSPREFRVTLSRWSSCSLGTTSRMVGNHFSEMQFPWNSMRFTGDTLRILRPFERFSLLETFHAKRLPTFYSIHSPLNRINFCTSNFLIKKRLEWMKLSAAQESY